VPRSVQGAFLLTGRRRNLRWMRAKYGDAFTIDVPVFGRAMVISNPAEIKQLFTTPPELADNLERNLGRVLGPGSLFAKMGEDHRKRRKLLVPSFHGRRLAAYERIIEEETVRELSRWPVGREFPVMPSMMRITLNAILKAVFGAEGAEFAELRELLPSFVELGSRLMVLPIPAVDWGRFSPWGRFWLMRRQYDAIVDKLIDKASPDGDDVLSMMLQSRYDDGSAMTRSEIADQLLTLLTAGHETTATTLAWTVERLRRHPDILRRLTDEVDSGGSALRQATILEVQRSRPVIDLVGRQVRADSLQLGRWTVPRRMAILVGISLVHEDEAVFPNAKAFDPGRFLNAKPDLYEWIPFGGGTRRCVGAAFANMEMTVVLRTMLRDLTLLPTNERDERWHSRGIANAPGKGGLAVLQRRPVRDSTGTGTDTDAARSVHAPTP
jgi:cytochrome P450 family 138